jgi:hypothetical protein
MYFRKENIYFGIVLIIMGLISILFNSFVVRFQIRNFGHSIPSRLFKWTPEKDQRVGEILGIIVSIIFIIMGILSCLGILESFVDNYL